MLLEENSKDVPNKIQKRAQIFYNFLK
jgi:hypothetical protein